MAALTAGLADRAHTCVLLTILGAACATHQDAPLRTLDSGEQIRVITQSRMEDGSWFIAYCSLVGLSDYDRSAAEAQRVWRSFESEANSAGVTEALVWPTECARELVWAGWRPTVIEDNSLGVGFKRTPDGSWKTR
jgi:hypothetical protein